MVQSIDSKVKERTDARITSALQEVTDENIDEMYARCSNLLKTESHHGINKEEYEFLFNLTIILEEFLVQKFMESRGWYQSADDEWNRWERC